MASTRADLDGTPVCRYNGNSTKTMHDNAFLASGQDPYPFGPLQPNYNTESTPPDRLPQRYACRSNNSLNCQDATSAAALTKQLTTVDCLPLICLPKSRCCSLQRCGRLQRRCGSHSTYARAFFVLRDSSTYARACTNILVIKCACVHVSVCLKI